MDKYEILYKRGLIDSKEYEKIKVKLKRYMKPLYANMILH